MKAIIEKLMPKIHQVFTYLHGHPEISWQEDETTTYIHDLFARENCKITTFSNSPGLIIDIGSGKPIIGIRADMDALWQEVDGTLQANHSCGHDAHMSIVIGTLWTMLEKLEDDELQGTFRFVFQPAEEVGAGALSFVEKGIVDDVDFLYGMHVRPIEELTHGHYAPAIQHGAARFIDGEILGEDAHGARPHLNVNAIEIGTAFVQQINQIHMNPMIPYSVKMTAFHAGGKNTNIIPGKATFSIDVRAQTNEVMEDLTEKVYAIADMLSIYHHVPILLKTSTEIAAAVLNEEAIHYMETAIAQTVGEGKLKKVITTSGGDDFHFYTIKRPHLKATMLAIGCDLQPGLHHPNMTFNHDAIPTTIEIMSKVLWGTASNYKG